MILDALLAFEPVAGTTFTTGTNTSTNQVDIGVGLQTTTNPLGLAIPGVGAGAGARDLGIGDDPAMKLLVEVTGAPTGGTSLQITILGAPDSGSGTPGAFTTYASGPVVATANILVGTHLFDIDMPRVPPGTPLPRYLELQYVIVGTFSPGVTLRAYLVIDRHDQIYSNTVGGVLSGYPPGITIAN